MPVSDVLKSFRKEGYGEKSETQSDDVGSPRSIKLTDEEIKGLAPYAVNPGEEIVLEVTGRLQGNDFAISSAKYADGKGEEDDMASEIMNKMQPAPTMRPQTMPSPS